MIIYCIAFMIKIGIKYADVLLYTIKIIVANFLI